MTITLIVKLLRDGILTILMLASPILGSALIIGLIVAIFQATTSIQEQTLTFLPKMLIMLLIIAVLGGWMFNVLGTFTINLFEMIPKMAR